MRFADPDNPNKGLAFDGRTAEEFKLANGTWVSAGTVRVNVVAAVDGPLADTVICGLNEKEICALGFLNAGWCARELGEDLPLDQMRSHPAIVQAVKDGMARYNAANPKTSARIARMILQPDAPRADAGEITEKGYINQMKSHALRAEDVARLYSGAGDEDVLEF